MQCDENNQNRRHQYNRRRHLNRRSIQTDFILFTNDVNLMRRALYPEQEVRKRRIAGQEYHRRLIVRPKRDNF